MTWLFFALAANFLFALTVLLDKYLVTSSAIGRPAVYAFYIGAMSAVVVLLLLFGVVLSPAPLVLALSLAVGLTYIVWLVFFYCGLQLADASDVAPAAGAIAAVVTFLFSRLILGAALPVNFLLAFVFLLAGTGLMVHWRFSHRRLLWLVLLAGLFFGLSSVLIKLLFLKTSFLDAFFWSRLANVFGALLLLLWPGNAKAVFRNLKTSIWRTKFLVVGNKFLAGLAFLFLLAAIKLGEVSLVNALNVSQYVFLLLFALLFAKKFPDYILESRHHGWIVWHKLVATGLIIAGFYLLFR